MIVSHSVCQSFSAMIDPSFQILLWLLAALLIVVGFAGLILPALPGIPLVFAGLVLLAWAENFAYVGWLTLTVLGVLTLVSIGVDFLAAALGAKKFGASSRAIWGAAIGAVLGLFFGLPGLLLGPFVGAVIGEFSGRATPDGGDACRGGGDAGAAVRHLAEDCAGLCHAGRVRAGSLTVNPPCPMRSARPPFTTCRVPPASARPGRPAPGCR